MYSAAFPTWPKVVVCRKVSLPANFCAESAVRWLFSKASPIVAKTFCSRAGHGWRSTWLTSQLMNTPNILRRAAGGFAFLAFIFSPNKDVMSAKWRNEVLAKLSGSQLPKSSTKCRIGIAKRQRPRNVNESASLLKAHTEAVAPKHKALCLQRVGPIGVLRSTKLYWVSLTAAWRYAASKSWAQVVHCPVLDIQ